MTFFRSITLSRRGLIAAALVGLEVGRSKPARAGSLRFDPMFLEFPAGRVAAALSIANGRTTSTVVQTRCLAWSQRGDEDPLEPTADLIVSPPIATVEAGETQIVRLFLRRPHAEAELHYRLLVDEIPSASGDRTEVAVAFNASLPVLVAGTTPGHADLEWQVQGVQGRQLMLLARNSGTQAVRINQMTAALPGEPMLLGHAVARNPYVLPGAERQWYLPLPSIPAHSGRLRLSASTSVGPSTVDLALTL